MEQLNIQPPNPQSNEDEPGKFLYIADLNDRLMLSTAYKAISLTESWDFVKQDTKSFMFSDNPRIYSIIGKISELGYDGHSGASFGCVMREMQYIAKYGELEYKNYYFQTMMKKCMI